MSALSLLTPMFFGNAAAKRATESSANAQGRQPQMQFPQFQQPPDQMAGLAALLAQIQQGELRQRDFVGEANRGSNLASWMPGSTSPFAPGGLFAQQGSPTTSVQQQQSQPPQPVGLPAVNATAEPIQPFQFPPPTPIESNPLFFGLPPEQGFSFNPPQLPPEYSIQTLFGGQQPQTQPQRPPQQFAGPTPGLGLTPAQRLLMGIR